MRDLQFFLPWAGGCCPRTPRLALSIALARCSCRSLPVYNSLVNQMRNDPLPKGLTMLRLPFRSTLALALVVAGTTALGVSAQSGGAKATISGEGIKGTVTLREVPAMTSPTHDMKFMTGMMAVELTVNVTGLKPG